jgi:hypothetical protein
VYEWHAAWAFHTDSAAIVITTASSSTNVTVNQQSNGGQWNLLATVTLTSPVASVTVASTSSSYYTAADAIKFLALYVGEWHVIHFDSHQATLYNIIQC